MKSTARVSQPGYRPPVMAATGDAGRGLPRVAGDAAFVPMEDLAGASHAVVDGPLLPGTVLSLSHWRGSGTPDALRDDTSALIVLRYLAADADGPEIRAVTNNHYDEDGLFAIWLLLERPPEGSPERALAVAAAEAGDFGTWTDPWAPRVAIAAMSMAERGATPFPEVGRILATAGAVDPAGRLYRAILPRVAGLLADPDRYRMLWRPRWSRIEADIALLDAGDATVEDVPGADLALVRTPRPLDPMALHPRTPRMRILTALPDGTRTVTYRYETWVDYASRPLPPRVDLTPVAARLQAQERNPVRWLFEGVEVITPRLMAAGPGGRPAPTSIPAERIVEELAAA
jgi:hypothetical protein